MIIIPSCRCQYHSQHRQNPNAHYLIMTTSITSNITITIYTTLPTELLPTTKQPIDKKITIAICKTPTTILKIWLNNRSDEKKNPPTNYAHHKPSITDLITKITNKHVIK